MSGYPHAGTPTLRPLGTAEILDTAFRIVRRNARAVFAICVPAAIVRAGVAALVVLATYHSTDGSTLQSGAGLVLGGLLGTLVSGALTPIVSADLLGERAGARAALRDAGRRGSGVVLLVALGIVATLAQDSGLVLLVVGGVWLWGVWAVAAPAMVAEHLGLRAALGRSFQLVRRRFWPTWGVRALAWVVTSVLGFLFALPFTVVAAAVGDVDPFGASAGDAGRPGLYVTILAIGGVLSAAVTLPIAGAVDVLLYVDLRVRVEGLDIELALPPLPASVSGGVRAGSVVAAGPAVPAGPVTAW